MTELQFWKKALMDFEKPSLEAKSYDGICYYLGNYGMSESLNNTIKRKIWCEVHRLGRMGYIDICGGVRSEKRIRFIKRMICQCQRKKK
jgi:hypothetical protein